MIGFKGSGEVSDSQKCNPPASSCLLRFFFPLGLFSAVASNVNKAPTGNPLRANSQISESPNTEL